MLTKQRILFSIIISCLILVWSLNLNAQIDTISINRLKALVDISAINVQYFNRTFTVEGYFYKDPLPLLIKNRKWATINRPMPDSVYLLLDTMFLGPLFKNLPFYQGQLIRITGRLVMDTLDDEPFYFRLESPAIIKK